jgi:predicted phosphodiesterase
MRALGKIDIPVKSMDETWRVPVLSDVHWGNKGCAAGRFRAVVKKISRLQRCIIFMLGDQIDAISRTDKRFDASVLDDRALRNLADIGNMGEVLYDSMIEELQPIKDKIAVALIGNHESKYMGQTEQVRLHERFCEAIGARNGGYACFVDLVFTDPEQNSATFRVFAHHGAGAAATPGGKVNRLIRFMDMANADIALTGHTHESIDYTRTRLGASRSCDEITHVDQLGVVCGTYLRTYAAGIVGYGERAGYHPTPIGSPIIEITPGTRALGVNWIRG